MTRIVSLPVFLTLALLTIASEAHAGRPPVDKTNKGCQADLFAPPPKSRRFAPGELPRIGDLTVKQRELWRLQSEGKTQAARDLRLRLLTQLLLTPKTKLIKTLKHQSIYQATDLSYMISRDGVWGQAELAAQVLNDELGRPLNIPLTASRPPGSVQLWVGYQPEERTHNFNEEKHIRDLIAGDGDMFFFSFLSLNPDQHALNMILDPEIGPVIFDFEGAFGDSARGFFAFGAQNFNLPASYDFNFSDLELMLKSKMAQTNFNWRKALNQLDEEKVLSEVRLHLGISAAQSLKGRLCVVRSLFNGGNIRACADQGFAL